MKSMLNSNIIWWFQWISLVRSHAEVIVDDQVIFSVFKKFCKVCDEASYVLGSSYIYILLI